jgi:hypothetical protein
VLGNLWDGLLPKGWRWVIQIFTRSNLFVVRKKFKNRILWKILKGQKWLKNG